MSVEWVRPDAAFGVWCRLKHIKAPSIQHKWGKSWKEKNPIYPAFHYNNHLKMPHKHIVTLSIVMNNYFIVMNCVLWAIACMLMMNPFLVWKNHLRGNQIDSTISLIVQCMRTWHSFGMFPVFNSNVNFRFRWDFYYCLRRLKCHTTTHNLGTISNVCTDLICTPLFMWRLPTILFVR